MARVDNSDAVQALNRQRLADAARAFATADVELENSSPNRVDSGVVIASMAARHDMRLLCDLPCGCDGGTCPGLLSSP